jgi:hypothetical protein
MPDESPQLQFAAVDGIHDADLLQKLDEARGNFLYQVIVGRLQHEQKERDAKRQVETRRARLTPVKRRAEIVREVIENEPVTPDSLQFIHSHLALCGLPYRRLPESVHEYERKNGRTAIVVSAGSLRAPNGNRVQQPVPFGPKARLLIAHLSTAAVRNNSPTVEIADSLSGFMRELGIEPRGGARGTIHPFKEQVNALAACRFEISAWDGKRAATLDAKPFQRVDVWFPRNPDERMLWPTTITFSNDFYASLKKHAMPINTHVLRHLANSSRKLDLYFWLIYSLNRIDTRLSLTWANLANQFGDGFGRQRAFRAQLSEELADLKALFPKLPLKVSEQGITLEPAGTEVLAIPAPKAAKKS